MTDTRGLLLTPSGEPFATGSYAYLDARPGIREPLPRIYIELKAGGSDLAFLALLDTGGHYLILNQDVFEQIQDHLAEKVGEAKLQTAAGLIRGDLFLHRITLVADRGDSLDFEATVFVSPDWQGPCFLGYVGALDRICFSVHPGNNRWYFGPMS